MSRPLRILWMLLSSRALPPLILGFFLVIYTGIAFFTDETLIMLMTLTRKVPLFAAVLALLPLNCVCRMVREAAEYRARHRAAAATAVAIRPGLYDETVNLPASADFETVGRRLAAEGYKIRRSASQLAAWRGIPLLPARMLYLAGMFCLFSGILFSLVSRSVSRHAIIEGAPFPSLSGDGRFVEKIVYGKSEGLILEKNLSIQISGAGPGNGSDSYGVYPPGRHEGVFVYPRYLGVAVKLLFFAPDLADGVEKIDVLPLYPPGREAATDVPGTVYRVSLSLVKPEDGSDPYMTGRMSFQCKLMKGKEVLFTGIIPGGGEYRRDGYRLAIPDCRRMVMTDYVSDPGVYLIMAAAMLFIVSTLITVPAGFAAPRGEMLFREDGSLIHAAVRSEGRRRQHAGVFHEMLDLLEQMQNRREEKG